MINYEKGAKFSFFEKKKVLFVEQVNSKKISSFITMFIFYCPSFLVPFPSQSLFTFHGGKVITTQLSRLPLDLFPIFSSRQMTNYLHFYSIPNEPLFNNLMQLADHPQQNNVLSTTGH
jgi:hypothetical protein